MKYIVLDTNIYLSLFCNRSSYAGNASKAKKILSDLVTYEQCRLVIPEIVITEIKMVIEKMVTEASDKILNTKKIVKDIFWFDELDITIDTFETEKQEILKTLNRYKKTLEENKTALINDHISWLEENIFDSPYSSFIPTNINLANYVEVRKMRRLPPFHKKDNQYGDALIVETILNLQEFLPDYKREQDIILFCSHNYSDFCDDKNNSILHPLIQGDIKINNMKVKFQPHLYKMFEEDLQNECSEAEVLKYIEEKEMVEADIMDTLEDQALQNMTYYPMYSGGF